MRVLLVTNDYPPKPGGIQQYLGSVVPAMKADVRVLAPADGPAPGDVVRHRKKFMWPTPAVRRWVEGHIRDFEPDVVWFGAPHPLAAMGRRLRGDTGVPYVVHAHGAEVTLPAAFPVTRTLLRRPLAAADAVMAVSAFTARRVERLTGRHVDVVGGGVDVSAFTPGAPPPEFVVGCVSRFVPRKGQRRVIEAADRLHREGVGISVVLVGKGRDEDDLRKLVERVSVPVRFEVDVAWERLPELYREMTVFAMPCRSRWFGLEAEGLGLVFYEAAASGLPVLAGSSGGAPETIRPGETGFVATSVDEIADALRLLVSDPDLVRHMGAAGRSHVEATATFEAVADRIEAVLGRTVGAGRNGGGDTSLS